MNQKKAEPRFPDTGLTSHMEDYMETIYLLSRDNRVVRVKDIAKRLDIKMPSVTAALNKLKESELIDYEKYGFIELTENGVILAKQVHSRHLCLAQFFEKVLNLTCDEADNVACRVEHTLTPESCSRLQKFLDFYDAEAIKNSDWIPRLKKALS